MTLPLCVSRELAARGMGGGGGGAQSGLSGVSYRKELQEESITTIAELKLQYPVSPNLRHRCQSPRLEELAQARNELRGGGGRSPDEVGQVASESGVNDHLLLVVGLSELDEQDLGGQVVDVRDAEGLEALVELVGDDLRDRRYQQEPREMGGLGQ